MVYVFLSWLVRLYPVLNYLVSPFLIAITVKLYNKSKAFILLFLLGESEPLKDGLPPSAAPLHRLKTLSSWTEVTFMFFFLNEDDVS